MAKMNAAKATQQADIESLARTVADVSSEAAAAMDQASADLEKQRQEISDFAASLRPGANGG